MFSPIHSQLPEQDLDFETMMMLSSAVEGEDESKIEHSFNFQGTLRTVEKEHTFTHAKPKLSPSLEQGHKLVPHDSWKPHAPMKSAHRPLNYSELNAPQNRLAPQTHGKPFTPFATTPSRPHLPQPTQTTLTPSPKTTPENISHKNTFIPTQAKEVKSKTFLSTPSSHPKGKESEKPSNTSLHSQRWVHHPETQLWWQDRYNHHREDPYNQREGGQGQQKEQQEQEKQERQKKQIKVQKTERNQKISVDRDSSTQSAKPRLTPPRIGVFALYYILTKIGIASDGASNFSYKNEITYVDQELTKTRRLRLEELKVALEKEKAARRWGIAYKVFSWLASALGILAGAAMCLTGVGAFGGAMLMAAGFIQMTNQILEMTGTWEKIADKLPGDNPEKKRAVISWIQIGIAVLCLVLTGVSIVWGGFSQMGESMQTAITLISSVAMIGQGVISIGEGITNSRYCDKLAEVKKYEIKIARLKHQRRDLMEKVEWGIDRLEKLFEDLTRVLGFHNELFRADQRINQN